MGDLRLFNYQHQKHVLKKDVHYDDFFKDQKYEFGIMTLDGKQQARGHPYWINPYEGFSEDHVNFEKIAVDEMLKDVDMYLVDEIGESMFYSPSI